MFEVLRLGPAESLALLEQLAALDVLGDGRGRTEERRVHLFFSEEKKTVTTNNRTDFFEPRGLASGRVRGGPVASTRPGSACSSASGGAGGAS